MVTAAGCLPLLQHVDVASAADLVTTTAACDPAVSVWQRKGRFVYILGTAHVSAISAELAGQLVKDIHPNAVFVELDPKRISGDGILAKRMTDDGKEITSQIIVPQMQAINGPPLMMAAGGSLATASDIPAVAAATVAPPSKPSPPNPIMRAATAAVGNSIKSMYKKLDSSGLKAGEEFVVTMQEGQRIGSDIILGDRDVEVTLQRVTEALSKTDLKALFNPGSELEQSMKELVPSSMAANGGGDFSDPQFRDEFSSFIEVMKSRENVRKIMGQLQQTAPALYQALVGERDAYMAAGLNGLNSYEAIVAVMGIAHVDGVEQNLKLNGWNAVSLNCSIKR
jgi:pheromone shutdown protein TraB